MGLLNDLINNSSGLHIRTKEEVDQLFRELTEQVFSVDDKMDLMIRMSLHQVKLQFYYETKLKAYRQQVLSKQFAKNPLKTVNVPKEKEAKKKTKSNNRHKLKEVKAEIQQETKKALKESQDVYIKSHRAVDIVVNYLKANKKKHDAVTEKWIRQIIKGQELQEYYKEKMHKTFANYQSVVLQMLNIGSSKNNQRIQERLLLFQKQIIPIIKSQEKYSEQESPIRAKKDTSFEILKTKEWILDWNCVIFKRGYIQIYSSNDAAVRFNPTTASAPNSLESFNYLKKYLNDRLPPVRCIINGLTLKVIDQINFNEAIQRFAEAARQGVIKGTGGHSKIMGTASSMSLYQALSRAKQMSPEEFKKYKSRFIDYLVTLQSKNYKVIPCVERLAHTTGDTTEYAFMFSIESHGDNILIVYENVNPDRSTLLFLVKEEHYDKSIRAIYDFLQSAEINKRSSLREHDLNIGQAGIVHYRSINHDNLFTWRKSISIYYKRES